MKRLLFVLITLVGMSGHAFAEPVVDEETVRAISDEFLDAVLEGDMSVFEKYMYSGSKITIDVDPAEDRGELEIGYDEFMQLTKMAIDMLQEADIDNEVLSVSVNAARNEATIREETTSVMTMMGITMRDVSIATTTYGVVNGQIKVLETRDELISSEAVE